MARMYSSRTLVGLLAVVGVGLLLGGFVGGAAAEGHGEPWPEDADIENASDEDFPYRFEFFPDDHTPGAEGVTYSSFSGALEPIDGTDGYHQMDTVRLFYAEGTIHCEADDATVFGVDRGGDKEGTEVDEMWIDRVKRSDYREDRTLVNFYNEDDFAGDPPSLESGDIVKSQQADCYENPDQPGWYHAISFSNGTHDGEYTESYVRSEPFYICDCESEDEARAELGPPPHERDNTRAETPTPEATPTPTPGAAETPTPEATPTPTETPASTAEPASTPTSTSEASGAGHDAGDDGSMTPTPGDGPGFGPIVALLGLLGGAAMARRHT